MSFAAMCPRCGAVVYTAEEAHEHMCVDFAAPPSARRRTEAMSDDLKAAVERVQQWLATGAPMIATPERSIGALCDFVAARLAEQGKGEAQSAYDVLNARFPEAYIDIKAQPTPPEPAAGSREGDMTIINCSVCGGDHFGSVKCPYTSAPCVVCGATTILACSDCAIDAAGVASVHVCAKVECRAAHDKAHTAGRET